MLQEQELLDRELNDYLSLEIGWRHVAQGLTKILIGYLIWVVGNFLGLLLVLMPFVEVGFNLTKAKFTLGHLWMFYAGMGLLSIVGLFSCGWILAGQWKCMLNASERNGCRWLMFLCMTSMAMALGLSILSSLAGLKVGPEFSKGAAGFGQVRYTTLGLIMQIASAILGMLYTGSFALFLRAVAQSMDSRWHVRLVDLFLAFYLPLMIVSVYLSLRIESDFLRILKPLLFVGLGWFVCFVFWLTMIALVRSCILRTNERVRNPMEYSTALQARIGRPTAANFG